MNDMNNMNRKFAKKAVPKGAGAKSGVAVRTRPARIGEITAVVERKIPRR